MLSWSYANTSYKSLNTTYIASITTWKLLQLMLKSIYNVMDVMFDGKHISNYDNRKV